MILEGSKFSISFLKDNFSRLFLIVSLPFILELIITSISVNYMKDDESMKETFAMTKSRTVQIFFYFLHPQSPNF